MKKIATILSLAASTAAFAGSVSLEGASQDTQDGADQRSASITVSENITKSLAAHLQLSSTQTDTTNAVSTRVETGLTANTNVFGPVDGYARVAVGQKYSTAGTGNFTYYSVEPGVKVPLGTDWTASLGYRYRTAVVDAVAKQDTTETTRLGVAYRLSRTDSVAFRYDLVTGDIKQNAYSLSYTRSF
jgi:hypothetical protein